MDRHADNNFQWINSRVDGAMQNLGITNRSHLVGEFSRQIWWLYRFFEKLCPTGMSNSLELIYDNKHRYAQECRSLAAVVNPVDNIPRFWPCWKVLTSMTNTLLSDMQPKRRFPKVEQFTFAFSTGNYLIQACDMLANLFWNTLKSQQGITDSTSQLKWEMLKAVVPGLALDPSILQSTQVQTGADGKPQVVCVNPKLSGALQLEGV
jgi:hypothetical protein